LKLRDEHIKSYIDDIKMVELLDFLTWKGLDVAPTWVGAHEPATRSDDLQLNDLARFNRDHYLFYRALIERYVEKEGSIADVGCGTGSRSAMLARYATNVTAVDSDMLKISSGCALNGTEKISWVFADVAEWKELEPDSTFDYVFCVEVIEHVPLELHRSFFANLISRVSSGGALLMTTPRDKNVDRKPPHIGLWEDHIADNLAKDIGADIKYFDVSRLKHGGEDPWCGKEASTHYVVIYKKP
jgi:SAM-dependent methyltransferase